MEGPRVSINVKVVPRSSVNRIIGKDQGSYRIKLTAPPVDGKANKALIDFLAGQLKIAKGNIKITGGSKSKSKRLMIQGLDEKEVKKVLDGKL